MAGTRYDVANAADARFLVFSTRAKFDTAKSGLRDDAIAFIKDGDTPSIYTKAGNFELKLPAIVNTLVSTDTSSVLSAAQGKALKDLIDAESARITALNSTVGNNQSDVSTALDAIKKAIVAVARAEAANVLSEDGTTSGLTVTAGSISDNPTVDGSIMDGVTNTKIKVKIKSGETALKVDTGGLYIDQTKISIQQAQVDGLPGKLTTMDTSINNKVDKVEGKGLSTEDYTTAEKTKLSGIETGAQVNVLEGVKVNGSALTIDASKYVNIDPATIGAAILPITGLKDGEQILSIDTNKKIGTTLSLTYDTTNHKIILAGKDSSVISEVDCSGFIKDGILDSVQLFETAESGVSTEVPYLRFTFNSAAGKDPIRISVKSLVDIYRGDGTTIDSSATSNGTVFKVKPNVFGSYSDVSNLKTTVGDSTSGLVKKVNDISTQVDANLASINVINGSDSTNGSIKKAVKDASTALIGTNSDASTANTIYGAKAYADAVVASKNVTASGSGDSYITVDASATNNNVNVKVTAGSDLTSAITKANSALQASDIKESSTNGKIKVKGTDIAIHGLGSAAYTASTAYDTSGAATTAANNLRTELIGNSSDSSTASTFNGVRAYVDAMFSWYVD